MESTPKERLDGAIMALRAHRPSRLPADALEIDRVRLDRERLRAEIGAATVEVVMDETKSLIATWERNSDRADKRAAAAEKREDRADARARAMIVLTAIYVVATIAMLLK